MSDSTQENETQKWEKFVRWQRVTREQLSYSINLILGLSAASIGFEVSVSFGDQFVPVAWERPAYLLSLIFLFLSIGTGLGATISRLSDFRKTARLTGLKWKERHKQAEIDILTIETDRLGKVSWCLFYIQASSFAAAMLSAALVFLFVISERFS